MKRVVSMMALTVLLSLCLGVSSYAKETEIKEKSAADQLEKHEEKKQSIAKGENMEFDLSEEALAETTWKVLKVCGENDMVKNPYDVLGEYDDNYISFYGEDSMFEENVYGLYLSNYTDGEGDSLRWGGFKVENDVVTLKCDSHGDEITLKLCTVYDEASEMDITTLALTDTFENEDGKKKEYTVYFADQFDIEDLDHLDTDNIIKKSKLKENITEINWKAAYAYALYTDKNVAIDELYGVDVQDDQNNLKFNKDGTFTWSLGYLTSGMDGEMTGIYRCRDDIITLYSGKDTQIMKMEYREMDRMDLDTMIVNWTDNISEADQYSVYFIDSEDPEYSN